MLSIYMIMEKLAIPILKYSMNIQQIAELYDRRCEVSEFSWQASAWASETDQYGRYVLASSIVTPNSSVLDLGCGQGDILGFLRERRLGKTYTGVDVSPRMVMAAKRFGDYFICGDLLSTPLDRHDHVMALGTFSVSHDDPYRYLSDGILRCLELCEKSVCVTFLTEGAENTFDDDRLFYYNPVRAFEICLDLCKKVVFDTGSLSCEALVFLYK
jgi:SAM-dependent methyltransferase